MRRLRWLGPSIVILVAAALLTPPAAPRPSAQEAPRAEQPTPRRSQVTLFFRNKTIVPFESEIRNGGTLRLCNRDTVIHQPFSKNRFNRFEFRVLRGTCRALKLRNPTSKPIRVRIFDAIHSLEKAVVTVFPEAGGIVLRLTDERTVPPTPQGWEPEIGRAGGKAKRTLFGIAEYNAVHSYELPTLITAEGAELVLKVVSNTPKPPPATRLNGLIGTSGEVDFSLDGKVVAAPAVSALSESGVKAEKEETFTVKPRASYSADEVKLTIGIQDFGNIVYTYSVER